MRPSNNLRGKMNTLNFFLETAVETMQYYRAVMELYSLSDKDLNDIGLTRAEIPSAVFLANYINK
jgi:uncharacterized protein YjiS (DUF1127 family)